jgi:hypothetical protein
MCHQRLAAERGLVLSLACGTWTTAAVWPSLSLCLPLVGMQLHSRPGGVPGIMISGSCSWPQLSGIFQYELSPAQCHIDSQVTSQAATASYCALAGSHWQGVTGTAGQWLPQLLPRGRSDWGFYSSHSIDNFPSTNMQIFGAHNPMINKIRSHENWLWPLPQVLIQEMWYCSMKNDSIVSIVPNNMADLSRGPVWL